MNHEQLLREALAAKATEASVDLTLDDIRRDATRRTSRRRVVVALAAAAVVAVVVPTAVLTRPGNGDPTPAPSPAPSQTNRTSPSPAPGTRLDAIPRGADPQIPYLQGGVVHQPGGTTSRMPASASDVVAFTPYHGGWIVLDSVGGLAQLDNTGAEVRRSRQGEAALAVSSDLMRTAFQLGGNILVGISSGMGQGETPHAVGLHARLVGFLGDRVVYNAAGTVRAVDDAGKETVVPGLTQARATSPDGDLVAGSGADDNSIRVVSVSQGRALWTKSGWFCAAFSPDGRYLAAYRTATGGELETVAILDARTGEVVTTSDTLGVQALPAPPTAWEDDQHLLIPYRGGSSWALLRLATSGHVDRATDVVESPSQDMPPFVFAARP